jgi:acetyltransferase-like isoleucine patch superfamily enzyme
MPIPLLASLRTRIRPSLLALRRLYFRRVWGMDIGEGCDISFSARLDKTNPRGIHIGEQSIVTFGATILSHDFVHNRHLDTRIGRWCFVGAHSIILPGVEIGDHSIVGAGSVVVKNVPPHSLVAGNPARIIEADIETGPYGMRGEAWAKIAAGKQ